MLTNLDCKKLIKDAQEQGRPLKQSDAHGLFLYAQPNGSAYWRYKYRFMNKEKTLSLGVYPEISLAEAREMHRAAHKQVSLKIDPAYHRQETARTARLEAGNTFELVAREWHAHNKDRWSENHANTVLRRFELYLFPKIGKQPIRQITAPMLLDVLRGIEKRQAFEIARRSLQMIGQVFRYAITSGRLDQDVSIHLKGALKPFKRGNYAAMDVKDLPEFIHKLERNEARMFPQTRLALELMMLTFVRTGELIKAKWSEFDFDEKVWIIPAERMKMRREHIVPLSSRSIEILQELKALHRNREYVFPSMKNPRSHMSHNAMLVALDRMGYRGVHTGHGFRALAMSTIMEKLGYRFEVPDRQLAHKAKGPLGESYNRAQFLDERIKMMQDWADYLAVLK